MYDRDRGLHIGPVLGRGFSCGGCCNSALYLQTLARLKSTEAEKYRMAPNFLVIVADDLGFTDLSAFGGEIHTPNLAKLANRGIRITDFHTAAACSPTRSMLFTGTDNHIAGLGQMAEFAARHPDLFKDKPGYEGYLNDRVVSLPEILHDAGYYTFIAGKWHLGLLPEYWPVKRGFEKSYTLLPGAGNHYKYIPKDENGEESKFLPFLYAEDDRKVDAEKELPEDFYSTNFFTDKYLEFLDDKEQRAGRPFFSCLTYTAPHWPYQAPKERVDKYKGRYDAGPDALRIARLQQAIKAGVVPEGVKPHPVTTIHERWSELSDDEKRTQLRIMETYAAMVEILDENIGRVVDHLEASGELDNTFVLFMSDNGAEGFLMEALPLTVLRIRNQIEANYNNDFDNIGRKDLFVHYNDQWAQAATSPFSMYKMWTTEGAIVCPLILRYPPLLSRIEGQAVHTFSTVMDILPTILELAGVKHPGTTYHGRTVVEPKGKSWVKHLLGEKDTVHEEESVTGWELFGQQAIRKGPYKAVFIPKPFGPAKWQLYDIRKDPGETNDLAVEKEDKLNEMLGHWSDYVAETGLIEFGSDFFEHEKIDEDDDVVYKVIEDVPA